MSTITAVLLIAHGSRHAPANADLHDTVARFASRGDFPVVEPAFLELAEPNIAVGGGRCVEQGATLVLMVPYFLAAGVHLVRDLTAARDALSEKYPDVAFRLGGPLGPHPLLDAILAERARELASDEGASRFAPSRDMAVRYAPLDGPSAGSR